MANVHYFPDQLRQNNKLPIRVVAPGFGHLSPEEIFKYGRTHRKTYYFLLFMIDGNASHKVDLEPFEIKNNEVLFILPNQMHELPEENNAVEYFKIGFDESCLSLLPRQYPFLVNPLNCSKFTLSPAAATRLKSLFEILLGLLDKMDTDPELIIAYLNSLLTEINASYFNVAKSPANAKLAKYIDFKLFVENHLTEHPSVQEIAHELALNTNSLYQLVKHFSGLSPKEFLINRLILEAKRRLYYGQSLSIKELAFDLGFNDADYFSRLFKKVTGQTTAEFSQDLSRS